MTGLLGVVDQGGASPQCLSDFEEAAIVFLYTSASAESEAQSILGRSVCSDYLALDAACISGLCIFSRMTGLLGAVDRGGASLWCFYGFE